VTSARWVRPLGDTGPPLSYVIRDEPGLGQRAGTPRDLTGATSVIATVRRWPDRAIIQSAAATVTDPELGQVELPLTTTISSSPGLHAVEFRVVADDQRTYPADPLRPEWLLLAAPLVGGTAFTSPPTGGSGGGASYLHTEDPAASVWTVNHNLGFLTPDVTCADTAGMEFMGDINYVTVNQLLIINAAPIAGTAYIQA